MKIKPKSTGSAVIIILIALALAVFAYFNGFASTRTATKVGYIGNNGINSWSGKYTLLDGTMKRTLDIGDPSKTLHINIDTESGTLSVTINDRSGNEIFSKNNIETEAFDITVSGKITVTIKADDHKGSFSICSE